MLEDYSNECGECGGNGYYIEPACGEVGCCYQQGDECPECNGLGFIEVYGSQDDTRTS